MDLEIPPSFFGELCCSFKHQLFLQGVISGPKNLDSEYNMSVHEPLWMYYCRCWCMYDCALHVFSTLCAFAGTCWCVRSAPHSVGCSTMPSGEEIECEVQYSLGPSSVAVAQQLVH